MPAKYWMEVRDGVAYNKVWSPDGAADVQEHWVEVSSDSPVGSGWTWDGAAWTEPTVSIEDLRVERDALLTESDFTQLADSPLTDEQKAAWAAYRQELRDLPDSYVPVAEPEWPTKPE